MRGWEEREIKRKRGGASGEECGTSLSSWWRGNRTLLYYSSNKTIYTNRGRCHQHSWWLAPLIFHLILYICFYDLPANRNTQRESRSVMVDCAISCGKESRAGESEREWEKEQRATAAMCTFDPPNHKNHSLIYVCLLVVFPARGPPAPVPPPATSAPRDSHYLQFWLFTCFPFYALTHKVSVFSRN